MIYIYIVDIIILVLILLLVLLANASYKKSSYYQITHNSYIRIRCDIGLWGEYLTWRALRFLETEGTKFLFNCYLPKEDGGTTEIDALAIHSTGIFVFESKNYSGWIFGKESEKMWVQTLPVGKEKSQKEYFLNPVLQNKLHIRCLKRVLGKDVPVYSVIVFSERCTLKKVDVWSRDVHVVNRDEVRESVTRILDERKNVLSQEEIALLYQRIYPYTQVSEQEKEEHVKRIQNKRGL